MTPTVDASLFKLMADRVSDYAIFLLDPTGHVMSWNAGAALIKQYAAQEIIGLHFSQFYTPEDVARKWPDEELKRARMEGRFEDVGWRVKKDGTRFWANVIITALRDDGGTLLAYSKITRDLTQRKAEEERLRQSEERFRLLVDGVEDYAIYMLDNNGIVSSWNQGAYRIKGYSADEIIGKHFSRFYLPEDIEASKPWAELAMAREHGRAEDEGWRVRKDGSRFWASVVVTALYDAEGNPRGYAKVTKDLTQQRHADALEESANNLNTFIAVLAHELRNPLAAIRNAVQLQRAATLAPKTLELSRNVVDRQSSQLARIVDDLLDVSRVTRGTLSVDARRIEISPILNRAIETIRPAIEAAHHSLSVDASPVGLAVDGDELRLAQVFTNIISNACRYTESGGHIVVKAGVESLDGHQVVCVSVRDTGRGVAPEMIGSIFGMFVQGKDPLNRPVMGLGVGLALARSIVELHHGTIEAKSEGVNKGAEFLIRLPLKAPAPSEAAVTAAAGVIAGEGGEVRRYRILVVDDNQDAVNMLAALLKQRGHEVRIAYTGIDAVQIYDDMRPDFVFLDIGMPGMNGLEVARRIRQRERTPRPCIVAVTGWNKAEDLDRSSEAGFDLHLLKPVEETQLLEVLNGGARTIH